VPMSCAAHGSSILSCSSLEDEKEEEEGDGEEEEEEGLGAYLQALRACGI